METNGTTKRTVIIYQAIDEAFDLILGEVIHRQANGFIEEHVHPETIEITYFVKGEQVYTVGNENYPLESGDLFITLPGEQHSSGGHPKDKSHIFYMQIHPEAVRKLCYDEAEASELLSDLLQIKVRAFRGSRTLEVLLQQLLQYGQEKTTYHKTRIQATVVEYLMEVVRHAHQIENREKCSMMEVVDYIQEKIEEPLSIRMLAVYMGLSEGRLKANFRKEIGMPPGEYILRQKVKRAKVLLEEPSLSITDIAYQLGFSNSQYFATVFKRFSAVTPKEYRRTFIISKGCKKYT
ncbi:MAG: helix-turn-helix domain-containing protein [Cellulosilyticaceae bacterium]